MIEKRALHRHRVLKAGTIELGGSTIDCSVRNVSKAGAALEVATASEYPRKVHLAHTERQAAVCMPRDLSTG
jgi:hypothetical protein